MSDLISRQAAIDAIRKIYDSVGILGEKWAVDKCQMAIKDLPSAQPEITRCKDCGHFHYDMPYVIQGVPVLGHEVCDFWGNGCKTSENGYCSFAERREDERGRYKQTGFVSAENQANRLKKNAEVAD